MHDSKRIAHYILSHCCGQFLGNYQTIKRVSIRPGQQRDRISVGRNVNLKRSETARRCATTGASAVVDRALSERREGRQRGRWQRLGAPTGHEAARDGATRHAQHGLEPVRLAQGCPGIQHLGYSRTRFHSSYTSLEASHLTVHSCRAQLCVELIHAKPQSFTATVY